MTDGKQFYIVMLVAGAFVAWMGWRGYEIVELNEILKNDEIVGNYPYPHRVLRVDGELAVISSLRGRNIDARDALGTVYPNMRTLGAGHRDWQWADQELYRVQTQVKDLVLAHPGYSEVRWELDENWYHIRQKEAENRIGR